MPTACRVSARSRNLPGREPRFWLERADGRGGWLKGTKGVDTKIIYRADEVKKAIAEGRIIACAEGEKDADNLWAYRHCRHLQRPRRERAGQTSEVDEGTQRATRRRRHRRAQRQRCGRL